MKDDEIVSSALEDIKTVLDEKVKKGEMTKLDRDNILSKFRKVNVADAQAYRSLSSYRAILGMSGQWTDDMEQAYNNFKNGDWNIKDFNIIWQTKKPYVYTQVSEIASYRKKQVPLVDKRTGTQVVDESGNPRFTEVDDIDNPIYQKVPVQHKNSEFLLLAMHELIAGPLGRSGKLKAINEFMEDNDNQIDVVQFESTTKVGKQGVINLNDKLNMTPEEKAELDSKLNNGEISKDEYDKIIEENTVPVTSYKDTMEILKEATGIGFGNENPNVVHKISYEDYGIQTATPEHAIDAVQLVGTQIRKLITADISDDAIIEVNGKKMTKKEWLDLYNAINTENILQAFMEVSKIFKDPKEVEKILLEEIRGNQRYGMDMIKACTLDENGNFNIPLFDPVQSQRVQTLLNSVIKSRITKQKIRGGALIQVSDYGLTEELNIVFKDKEGNLLTYEAYQKNHKNATREDYEKFVKEAREKGDLAIAYLECYMPAYSREFYGSLMNPNTHQLDVTKLPDDLRKLIGYRVPTEDKYSMAPLYIKGFLPQQNGSAIMLPAEITTLSGSDFDVDKMYIMLPEFRVKKYDMRQAREDYAKINSLFSQVLSQFTHSQLAENILNADTDDFKEWFKENKEKYRLAKPIISKVKYDSNKSPQENSLEARNNLLIDMMYGVLTNADTASKILNPGGFDYQKKAARIVTILNDSYESDLAQALKGVGVELNKTVQKGEKSYPKSIASYLFDLDLDTLDKLAEKTKVKMDPLSPRTQVMLHQQNMTGAKLIGIYANHNANHALMQHTASNKDKGLALSKENGSFMLNGKRLTSLHDIMNGDKEFISKNNAGFLAASVDNVKDPILAALNQNTFTADASMLLSRLGYNPIEIGLLMMQPIVQEITQTYFRENRNGKDKNTIIKEVLKKYRLKAALNDTLTYDNYKNNNFYIEELADNIMLAKEITDDKVPISEDKINFYKKQVAVGYLFERIMNSANALGQVVQATRSDTQGGAAGPTIADTELKMQKVGDLLDKISSDSKFPLENADVILDYLLINNPNIDTLRKDLLSSHLPFLQAFYTLGLQETEEMLAPYFPQYTTSFRKVIDTLRKMTKSERLNAKTMNSIYNDLLAYIMSKNEFFDVNNRKDFINNFPEDFKKVVANNKDIADLEFINNLKVIRANDNNPIDTIVFKNVGQLTPTLRERYMRDWAYLLYMSNPEAQKLALDLFKYSYYRNGFAFGPSTFIHLAPVAVRLAVPEYINTLRSLLTLDDDYSQFVHQYIYNHLNNRKLVPEISDEASVSFIEENGKKVKDKVTFIIDDNTNFEDSKIIRKQIDTQHGTTYHFFNYISKKINGNYVYYKLTPAINKYTKVAIYERIEPLGFINSFIEYEYGKDVEEIESAFTKNRSSENQESSNSHTDTSSMFDNGGVDNTESDYNPTQSSRDSALKAEEEAFQQVYDTPFDTSTPKEDDITTIQPNTKYKDENGDDICGAPTLDT